MQVIKHARFNITKLENLDPLPVLRDAAKQLQPLGFWVGAGTLLGIIRDGCLIPHDTDLDFMLVPQDKSDAAHVLRGHELVREVVHDGLPQQRAYVKDGVIVDLAWFWPNREKTHGWMCHDVGPIRISLDLTFPLQWIEFEGIQLRIPAQPEAWLEDWYGANWRTPVSRYDTRQAVCTEER